MERPDILAAAALLATLRADGCVVAVDDGRLRVQGTFSEATEAAIDASKDALLLVLDVEGMTTSVVSSAKPAVPAERVAMSPNQPRIVSDETSEPKSESVLSAAIQHYPHRGGMPEDPNCPVLVSTYEWMRRMTARY
jgi:hypothetical protein